MLLVCVNEALGYTHRETLDSSYTLILSLMHEYTFRMNERNRILYGDDKDEAGFSSGEWVELVDFSTGRTKRYRKQQLV